MLIFCAIPPAFLFMLYWALSVASSRSVIHYWAILLCATAPALLLTIVIAWSRLLPGFDSTLLAVCSVVLAPILSIVDVVWAYVGQTKTN